MLAKQDRLRGVFSSQELRTIGTGTTQRKSVQKMFWFVEQDEGGTIQIQPVNTNFIPSGSKRAITMEELLEKYSPEPEFYVQSVFPKMRELSETVDRADRCREKGESFSAEFEYGNALNLDVDNVRANFGIGLTYLSRGEADKADNIFERLVHLDAAFQEEHKHLFNDFGISLRKNKMYDQAKSYYARALELTRGDENLYINMARTLMELGELTPCTQHLLEALRINPRSEMGLKFLQWLEERKLVPPEMRKDVSRVLNGQAPTQPQIQPQAQPQAQAAAAPEAPAPSGAASGMADAGVAASAAAAVTAAAVDSASVLADPAGEEETVPDWLSDMSDLFAADSGDDEPEETR